MNNAEKANSSELVEPLEHLEFKILCKLEPDDNKEHDALKDKPCTACMPAADVPDRNNHGYVNLITHIAFLPNDKHYNSNRSKYLDMIHSHAT